MISAERLNAYEASPESMRPFVQLDATLKKSQLDPSLMELVKVRVSQINGCAFCLELHTREARRCGETEKRLHLLNAWRESTLFSDRERAALAWAEALTNIVEHHASDQEFAQVRPQFNDRELAELSALIVLVNAWNRLAIGFRYQHE